MQDLGAIVALAQRGDLDAYNLLVYRFQDMAVAYATSILGDRGWAEDAAQEAFIEAFLCLRKLQFPNAFAAWLRLIVFKQCDRISRQKQVPIVSLDSALGMPSGGALPQTKWEQKESALQVQQAVAQLPEHERVVTLLFYMGQHSQAEIAEFLEIPVSTVKKRCFSARQRLKKELIPMIQENLEGQRPSNNSQFVERVQSLLKQFSQRIEAGESLVRALASLAGQESNTELRQVIAKVQQDITGDGITGATLSQAMAKHPNVFSPGTIAAIQGGEEQGQLQLVLQKLAR